MPFPYTFPFFFEVPLVYQLNYQIEVRDASGNLLRLITRVVNSNMSDVFNAPSELKITIPFDDPAVPFFTGPNELWLVNQSGVNIGKFTITEREDRTDDGENWVDVIAMSYMHQLTEEKIKHFVLEDTAENIVLGLLALQTNENPIVHGSLPASVTGLSRSIKVSSMVSIFQTLLKLIDTFFPNIRIAVDSDRNMVWTDLDATPGDLKQFRVTKNLRELIRGTKFERAITRLFAYGSRQSGNYIRLGDSDGDQNWTYRAISTSGQDVELYNVFVDNDDPSSIVKVGDTITIDDVELDITAITPSGDSTIITLSDTFTLDTPVSVEARRDFVESDFYGTLVRKQIFIDYTDVVLRTGYDDYVLNVDGTYKDLISSHSDAEVYFVNEDFATTPAYNITSYNYLTGALVASVSIPRVSAVKDTRIYLALARGPLPTPVAAGADNGTQVPFTIYPAVAVSGFKEGSFIDERIETVDMLQNTALTKIAEFQKPFVSFSAKAIDLSKVRLAEHEEFSVGEVIQIIDPDLNIDVMSKIYRADWPIGNPAELTLQFETEESRTIDAMFTDMAQTHFEPDPPLKLGLDALGDIGGDDVAHTHDNKDALDQIPDMENVQPYTFPSANSQDGVLWSNVPAIYDDDDGLDTAFCSTGDENLFLFNLSQSVPVNRTIVGVEIKYTAISDDTGLNLKLQLVKDDGGGGRTITGTEKTQSLPDSIFGEYIAGGATDLWGAALTVDIVNDSNFGVRIHIDDNIRIDLDWLKLRVYHTQKTGGSLRKVAGSDLEWAKEQVVHLAEIITGPGIGANQLYQVELLSPVDKSSTGVFIADCFVADDSAPAYLPGDLVTVAVPSDGSDAISDHGVILSATGGSTIVYYPTQYFGIYEGGVKAVFDGT